MKWIVISLIFLNFAQAQTCNELIFPFLKKNNLENSNLSQYSTQEIETIEKYMTDLNFESKSIDSVRDSLNYHQTKVELEKIELYLQYSNTFRGEKLSNSLLDIAQLGQREMNSKFVTDFEEVSSKLPKKYFLYKNQMSYDEFSNLYFSCKSAIPNPKNSSAKKLFTKFSMGLSTATLSASYVYYHRDEDKDFRWFAQMGYEVGFNAFTSYLGAKIQTNPSEPQYIKSLKNYYKNRIIGLTDIGLYPVLFPTDNKKVKARVDGLKNNPNFDAEIEKLHKSFDERGLYTKFKDEVISTYKELIKKKQPIEVAGIDWSNLTEKDLDRPEIQEVLTLAATAELYEMNRGPLLDTGDVGLDRYVFSSLMSAAFIPRNMVQSYITYQILCMGQKKPILALTQAAIFTSTINFYVGQVFYHYRKEAINQ